MKSRWFKIVIAIIRQILVPYDVYDRDGETGKVLYERRILPSGKAASSTAEVSPSTAPPLIPIPVKWATVVARVISLIMALLAVFFTGDQLDWDLIERIITAVFGETE